MRLAQNFVYSLRKIRIRRSDGGETMKQVLHNVAEAIWTAAYGLFLGWLIIRVLEG